MWTYLGILLIIQRRKRGSKFVANWLKPNNVPRMRYDIIKGYFENKIMIIRQRRYSKEELARRGKEIYESQIRQQVEASNLGKIIAIDIDTGAYEIADDTLIASSRLLEQYPDAQTWFIRIGHRGVHRFGWHETTEKA